MAQSGFDEPEFEEPEAVAPQPGDAAPKISGQEARQGQNIKGMLLVLIIGVALVALAYAVMLALSAEPSSVVNESANDAASAPVTSQFPSGTPDTTTNPPPSTPQ